MVRSAVLVWGANEMAPWEPLATWTLTMVTSGSALACSSNAFSRVLVCSAEVPTGSVTRLDSMVEPPKSKRLTGSLVAANTATASIAAVATSTPDLRIQPPSAHPSTGRYARTRSVGRSCPRRTRQPRKRLTSTGTMVRATISEARSATVTVTEKARKSSVMKPPTRAMGRKTATVVRVLETIAIETSEAPFRAASRGASPAWRCR